MLKKIKISEMRLGMHLHGLEGSWLDHPFWRSRFVLADPADLEALQRSALTHGWIDPTKGIDVTSGLPAAPEPTLAAPPGAPRDDRARPAPTSRATVGFDEELGRAATICEASRREMQKLYAEVRMGKALDAESLRPMVQQLTDSVFRNPGPLVSLSRLKRKDDYSYVHSVAVCALMVALGRMMGLDVDRCREAGLAGLLHDVGKAVMPLDLLNKPGSLTDAEFVVMRSHPERGHALLSESGGVPETALDVCLHHHERFDGSGYPHQLGRDALSPIVRMSTVCDVYDAISSNRPYKAAWDPAIAIARMASWKGHFDPQILAAFVQALGIYPIGSLVRLRSDRIAVVVEQHPEDPTAPTVRIFHSARSDLPVPVLQLDLSRADAGDAIASREPRERWNFPQLETLWAGDFAKV